jgi:putative heme transporter
VLVVAVFGFALPQLASYRDVIDAASNLSWPEIAALAVAVVINLVTFAPPWMAALPGLGFLKALTMTQASQAAASTLPGGEAGPSARGRSPSPPCSCPSGTRP